MSYQVIARKYRPQRFSAVVGQEHVTQTLAHAIQQNRIAHAYLFCGPRGTGKTTIARIFAKCLNATGGPRVDFDDADPRCREIAEGRSLDVLEIDAASNRGIDEIRGLREAVKYVPAVSKFKVYIIDEVHMLTKEAFNALLKTLEEPPAHVKFMFATTEPEKVLPTILSRCQRFDLRRIPAALIVKHLDEIARKEQVKVQPAALYAMARGAEGAMRDAQSALDQLISFCGDTIEEADVLSMFGLTARQQLLDLSGAILAGQIEAALRQLNDLAAHGKDLGRLLADLLNHFRNLLLFRISRGDPSLLEVSEAEAAALAGQAKLGTTEGLTRMLEVLGDAELRLRDTPSKKILLEITLLKAIEARDAVSLEAVLKRLEELRAESGGGQVVSLPTPAPAPPPGPKPFRAETVAAAAPQPAAAVYPPAPASAPGLALSDAASRSTPPPPAAPAPPSGPAAAESGARAELDRLWAGLLEGVGRASPAMRACLLEARPVSFDKDLLTVGFSSEFEGHIGLVDDSRTHSLLRDTLASLGHPKARVKFIKTEAVEQPARSQAAPRALAAPPSAAPASPNQKPSPIPSSQEDFRNDPLIRKALEIFKGQIVEAGP